MYRLLIIFLLCASANAQMLVRVIPSGTSTLNTGLIAFWKLDEESGTRNDSKGSNHLTDNNTVLYGAGKISNAADFEKDNSEYLSITDNADLSFGDEDFTIALWIKSESAANYRGIVSKASGSSAASREYILINNDGTKPYLFLVSNGTNTSQVISDSSVATGRWQFVIFWHSTTTDSLYIKCGAGVINRAVATYHPRDHTADFYLGLRDATTSTCLDGLLDLVGVWGRCPVYTNGYAMADSIYNSGSGWQP
jgi:hypothetical protein